MHICLLDRSLLRAQQLAVDINVGIHLSDVLPEALSGLLTSSYNKNVLLLNYEFRTNVGQQLVIESEAAVLVGFTLFQQSQYDSRIQVLPLFFLICT